MSIDTLPAELLVQIFTESTGPLIASYVSRRWRAIALDDPRLWVSPYLEITRKTKSTHLHLINLWLERSSSQLLHITLKIPDSEQYFVEDSVYQVANFAVTLFQQHAARIQELTLAIPSLFFDENDFHELCTKIGVLPNLEVADITLDCWKGGESRRLSAIHTLFSKMPALRDLRWKNHQGWTLRDSSFASGVELLWTSGVWTPLTTLILDTFITLDGALDVLIHCILLENLELRRFAERPSDFETFPSVLPSLLGGSSPPPTVPAVELYSDTEPLYLPALRELTIYQYTLDTALHGLFTRIVCTSLTHLGITCGFLPGPHAPVDAQPHAAGEAVVGFLIRSHAPVESLHLESVGLSVAHVESCLRAVSNTLMQLEMYDKANQYCIDDTLLGEMTVNSELDREAEERGKHKSVLCPKMHTLVLCRVVDCMNGALAEMIRSRIESYESGLHISKLEHVDIILSRRQQVTNVADAKFLRRFQKYSDW